MNPIRFRALLACALLLAAILPGGSAVAQTEADDADLGVLEQIVATVDDEVVLLGEIVADLRFYVMQSGQMPAPTEQVRLLQEAREGRIQEKLLVAKARRDEIQVGEEEVDQALDRHIARLREQAGGDAAFERQLQVEGVTERELRRNLKDAMRDQLLAQRVVERATSGLSVSEEEVAAYYERNLDDAELIPRRPRAAMLSHIVTMPKPTPEHERELLEKLTAVRSRLEAGEEFGAVATALSEGPAAPRGGDLGWWELEDIALPELAYAVANLAPGEVLYDVRSEQGFHIVKMEEREGSRVHFRQIFFALPVGETERQDARDRARAAWQRLQSGEDWDAVVADTSDDEPTRENGGRLPAIPEEQLDERYLSIVEALEPGEYSGVFLGKHGYQILRLEGRETARPYALEEIADRLRAELLNRKRGQAMEEYVRGLEGEILVSRKELPPLERIAALSAGEG